MIKVDGVPLPCTRHIPRRYHSSIHTADMALLKEQSRQLLEHLYSVLRAKENYMRSTAGLKDLINSDSIAEAKPYLPVLILLVLLTILLASHHLHTRLESATNAHTATNTKPSTTQQRVPGTWNHLPFIRPQPTPYPNWSITETKPLQYRPFRHGPKYNITMGLRAMSWDEWIELDNHYLAYHAEKLKRIASRGARCSQTTTEDPKAWDAAVELLEEFRSYLPARYPELFTRTEVGMRNQETEEVFDLRPGKLSCNGVREDPMQLAGRMVQDDLAIMVEGRDGQYYLLAGSILLAGFWRLEDKIGMPLSEIHTR